MKIWISLLALLWLNPSWAWQLSAEGEGQNISEAKSHALSALSRRILTEVKAQNQFTTRVNNDQVNRSGEQLLSESSNLILKGVTYQTQGQGVVAIFSENALAETLAFYAPLLEYNPLIKSLPETRDDLLKLKMYQAVLLSAPAQWPQREEDLARIQTTQQRMQQRLEGAYVQITSNVPQAQLRINGQVYPLNQAIALPSGQHQWTLSAKDYQDLTQTLNLQAGQVWVSHQNLVPSRGLAMTLVLMDDISRFTSADFAPLMQDVSWQMVEQSPLRFEIRGQDQPAVMGQYVRHNWTLRLSVYREEERLKSVKYSHSFTLLNTSSPAEELRALKVKLPQAMQMLAAALGENLQSPLK